MNLVFGFAWPSCLHSAPLKNIQVQFVSLRYNYIVEKCSITKKQTFRQPDANAYGAGQCYFNCGMSGNYSKALSFRLTPPTLMAVTRTLLLNPLLHTIYLALSLQNQCGLQRG